MYVRILAKLDEFACGNPMGFGVGMFIVYVDRIVVRGFFRSDLCCYLDLCLTD